MSENIWSEVAKAYDDGFRTLEHARAEYHSAINAVLETIEMEVRTKLRKDPTPQIPPVDPARRMLCYSVTVPGENDELQVLTRISTPWEQQPIGLLRVVLVSKIDSKWIGDLRQLTDKSDWVKSCTKVEMLEKDWLYGVSVELSKPNVVALGAEVLCSVLHAAEWVLNEFPRADLDYRMERCFPKWKERLQSDLGGRMVTQPLPEFPTLSCLEMVLRDVGNKWQATFWAGYERNRRCIMFGYNCLEEHRKNVNRAVHERFGAASWEQYPPGESATYPHTTILEESALRESSDDNIYAKFKNAFATFLDVISQVESTSR
jgi:hypothetical protein